MSDNQGGKLKLNLNAKEFKPKFLSQNQQNMQNPYMQYDMNNPYGYMNYPNQYGMPMNPYGGYNYNPPNQGYMNQPQFPNQNVQNTYQQPPNNPPQSNQDDDEGIVGLKKKKNKKKKMLMNIIKIKDPLIMQIIHKIKEMLIKCNINLIK